MRNRGIWLIVALGMLIGGGIVDRAAAQTDVGIRVQQFEPNADGLGYFATESARTVQLFRPIFSFHLNYANGVLGAYSGDKLQYWVVQRTLGFDLQAGMGFNVADVVVHVPFAPYQEGEGVSGGEALGQHPFGDIAIKPKVRFLDPEARIFGLALAMPVSFPSGNAASLYGDQSVTVAPTGIAEVRIGPVDVATNLGFLARKKVVVEGLTVGTQFLYRFAVRIHPIRPLGIQAEVFGVAGGGKAVSSPANFLGGVNVATDSGFVARLGIGTGLGAGYGAPRFRLVFGIGYSKPAPGDRDRDKIVDKDDACPEDPEDMDDFEDADGCPELDNDGDGFLDPDDRCPNSPETVNGFDDHDGCPDTPPDTDLDGLTDDVDPCPTEAEDFDGFEDGDGCPESDNDGDGILDGADRCPEQPETFNDFQDEDGCPDEATVQIDRESGRIRVLDKIYFDTGKSTLKAESFSILNKIADTLLNHGEVAKVEVQGHTDERGPASSNQKLSHARADAVRTYLVNRGVRTGRLVARGYGEETPLDPGSNEEAWSVNRRVEFHIVE